jgi:MoaA/NifB/PqqE/SkfB family radical SAM enzyme
MSLLYTKTKIFHFTDKLDSLPRQSAEIKPPLHIRIKPTNVCNHNCCYCAYRSENLQLGKDMVQKDSIPRDKMLEIIDDLIEMGVQAVTFSGGGEPFCYPHLAEIAEKLAISPIQFAALTNGSNLKGRVAEIFSQHATWLRVSMDGWDGPSYASYRKVKTDEFDKVMANMKNFKKLAGPCYLGVSFIIDKNNAAHVFEFIQRLRDTGVDSVKVSPCIVDNDGAENNRYHRPVFEQVKEQVARAKEKLAGEDFEIYDAYHELEEKFKKSYNWCPYLQILPVIGADLHVYSCQDKAYNLEQGLIGSIESCRFKTYWLSNKEKFFRINPSEHCNHHCVANEKNKLVLEYLQADQRHLGFV